MRNKNQLLTRSHEITKKNSKNFDFKNIQDFCLTLRLRVFVSAVVFLSVSPVFADYKVEMDDLSTSATPAATPAKPVTAVTTRSAASAPTMAATAKPAVSGTTIRNPALDVTPQPSPTMPPTAIPTPIMAQGFLKMRDIYQAGINSYKEQDFAQAIIYLKRALAQKDTYTKKYYYAEANAMLGVIYQFNIIDKKLAYQYYRAALDVDPETETALKHIGEVSDVKKVEKKVKKAPKKTKKAEKHKVKKKAKKKKTKARKTNEDL